MGFGHPFSNQWHIEPWLFSRQPIPLTPSVLLSALDLFPPTAAWLEVNWRPNMILFCLTEMFHCNKIFSASSQILPFPPFQKQTSPFFFPPPEITYGSFLWKYHMEVSTPTEVMLALHHVEEDRDGCLTQFWFRSQSHLQDWTHHRRNELDLVRPWKGGKGWGRKWDRFFQISGGGQDHQVNLKSLFLATDWQRGTCICLLPCSLHHSLSGYKKRK